MCKHETITCIINEKEVQVDVNLASFIMYMNGLSGVRTLFCCEGHDDSVPFQPPYILFYCDNNASLMTILNLMNSNINKYDIMCWGKCYIDYYDGQFRYKLQWDAHSIFIRWKNFRGF